MSEYYRVMNETCMEQVMQNTAVFCGLDYNDTHSRYFHHSGEINMAISYCMRQVLDRAALSLNTTACKIFYAAKSITATVCSYLSDRSRSCSDTTINLSNVVYDCEDNVLKFNHVIYAHRIIEIMKELCLYSPRRVQATSMIASGFYCICFSPITVPAGIAVAMCVLALTKPADVFMLIKFVFKLIYFIMMNFLSILGFDVNTIHRRALANL